MVIWARAGNGIGLNIPYGYHDVGKETEEDVDGGSKEEKEWLIDQQAKSWTGF